MKTNFEVIDQFFAAQVACNESEATLKALRPQVEEAVQALIAERGLGKSFTGTIEYHGFKIVVRRPTGAEHPDPRFEPRLLQAVARVLRATAGECQRGAGGPQACG